MSTKIEAAVTALYDALAAGAAGEGSALVAPIRDVYAVTGLGEGDRVVNVLRGGLEKDVTPLATLLGSGDGLEEFVAEARLELTCAASAAPTRRASVDAMAAEAAALLIADRTLDGAVSSLEIGPPMLVQEDLSGQAGVTTLIVPIRFLLDAATLIG